MANYYATDIFKKIAKMGSNYINLFLMNDEGKIKSTKKINIDNSFAPYISFINKIYEKHPDKTAYGRNIVITIYGDGRHSWITLTRITDPEFKFGAYKNESVDFNFKKIPYESTQGYKVYYQYSMPESVARYLVKNADKLQPEIDKLYKEFTSSIYYPAIEKYKAEENEKLNQEKEATKARKEKEANYTQFGAFDSASTSNKKREKLFGPHYKELDLYGVGSTDLKTWDLYKKEYKDEIPDIDEAEYYLRQARSSYLDARMYHDYMITPDHEIDDDNNYEWRSIL